MNISITYQRSLVGWLSLAQLISWGSVFYTFALIMGPVERELGLSRVEASVAFSLALLVEGLLAYPVGRWIDRGHERIVMTTGSVLAAVCLMGLGAVQSRMGFYLAWAGLGAAMAAILYTPVFAIVTRRFPYDFRRAIITMTFLGGLASTVFIPLTAWLISGWGWRSAITGLAALHLLVCAPVHALVLRNAPVARVKTPVDEAPVAGSLSNLFLGAPFLLVGCFVILMTSVSSALPAHMISLLRENGLSEAWVIAIPASLGVFQVLGRLLLYFFEHHFDLHLANRLIPGLIPAGLLALLVAPWLGAAQTAVVVLFVVLFGMGNGMLTIVKGTAMAQYVSLDHVATLNGALGLPLALARAAAPLALGWMWTPQAGYGHGLWALLITAAVGVAALFWAQQHSPLRNHAEIASKYPAQREIHPAQPKELE
ncbi:MAG: MFS transporter [Comamonadaceae bacterium]